MNLIEHLKQQREFSLRTFGPGMRTKMVVDHIRKELDEVQKKPDDLTEWVDIALLALDGAWRAGFEPEEIAAEIIAKQSRNEKRVWPDWRTSDPNKAIEHIRTELPPPETHVLLHYNDEAGVSQYSVEPFNDVGNWITSFPTIEEAETFIQENEWVYSRSSDFRNTQNQ